MASRKRAKPCWIGCCAQHPDTPKSRAKQWILAGRVSVNGVVIRKPHQNLADPGDALELGARQAATLDCGSGWQIHPRVSLLYLDSRPGDRQQGARPHLGAGRGRRPVRAEHPGRFSGGQTQGPGPRRRRKVVAARLSPARTVAGSSPGPIYQRRLLHGHEPGRAPPPHRAVAGAHHEAGICGLRGRPAQHAQRHLAAMAAIEPGRTAPARPFRNARPSRRVRSPRGHHPLRSHRRISARRRRRLRHQIAAPAGNRPKTSNPRPGRHTPGSP